MVFIFDLDDTVLDLVGALCDFYNEKYEAQLSYGDYFTQKFDKVWGCSFEDAKKIVGEFFASSNFDNMQPYAGVVEDMLTLPKEIKKIVVTARLAALEPKTIDQINRYFPNGYFTEIHHTDHYNPDTPNRTKLDFCKEIEKRHGKITVAFEDNYEHAEDYVKAGYPVIMRDALWNSGKEHELIYRVSCWRNKGKSELPTVKQALNSILGN